MRTIDNLYNNIEYVSPRVRRLYAIACYEFLKSLAKSAICDEAVRVARDLIDEPNFDDLVMPNRVMCKQYTDQHQQSNWTYKVELAVELASLCVAKLGESHLQLNSIIWAFRGFYKEKEVDTQILDCLNLIGPGRRESRQWPSHVIDMAQAVYGGDHEVIPILADAVEEFDVDASHLRSPGRHWKGCWIVDNILGRS